MRKTKKPLDKNLQPEEFNLTTVGSLPHTDESLSHYIYNRSIDSNCLSSTGLDYIKYNNLINNSVGYQSSNGFWNIKDYVVLCQTAWRYVPVFYQTIEIMTTLANTGIKWFGGSEKGKKIFNVWWNDKVGGHNLTEQSFRELLRSSNLFLHRHDGSIKINKINKFVLGDESKAAKSVNIPVKYVVLNPADICTFNDLSLGQTVQYYRTVDINTLNRLKALQDNKDAKINLDTELKEYLKTGMPFNQPLQPENLHVVFYRKQDYEPFAIPMGFSVLEDINLKLEFKKCDALVAKTVESMILLVKHGNEPDKGGMNPLTDAALKQIFRTKRIGGRTVISDYTTEMEFIIPDMKKVIGPEKYEKLDQDINDGLMNIFFGEQKFANIAVKLRVFVSILNYLQSIFLNEFLIPEVKRIGKLIGLSDDEIPTPKFKKIILEDKTQSDRIVAQLLQLGILTGKDGLETIETGLYPEWEDLLENQKEYTKLRDKSMFLPLVGGADKNEETTNNGRPPGTKAPQKTKKVSPKGTSSGSYQFDIIKFKENILLADQVCNKIDKIYLKANKITKLTDSDRDTIKIIATHLITNENPNNWESKINDYIKRLPDVNIDNCSIATEIKEVNNVDDFTSALLLHSIVKNE